LQKKQRHECNIQQRTWAWPYLFGVDFECGLPEADRSESHHHATQHDQQQAGDVSDDLTARTQARNVRSFAAWSLYRSIIGRRAQRVPQ
jgi:hypothetical protein